MVPTLAHARQHLLRPGAVLAPCRLRVLAAVAASASLHRLLRPPAAVCGGAVATGALAQLAPRKVDCQVGEAGDLLLLTQPTPVLSVDFAADDLLLADSSTALLECLPQPQPLAAWVAAQGGGPAAGPAAAAAAGDCGSAGQLAAAAASGDACTLYAVGWFEYEFPGGVAGCSAPHLQCSEHWQQVVQPLGGAAAGAALERLVGGGGGGAGVAGLLLTAGYRVDRLWFELEGLAARKRTAPDGSAEGHSP